MVYLRLHARIGYLRIFFLKELRKKSDLGKRDKLARVINNTRSRPKGVQEHKIPQDFHVQAQI